MVLDVPASGALFGEYFAMVWDLIIFTTLRPFLSTAQYFSALEPRARAEGGPWSVDSQPQAAHPNVPHTEEFRRRPHVPLA